MCSLYCVCYYSTIKSAFTLSFNATDQGFFSKSNRKFAKTSLLEKLGVAFLALPYAFTCESTLIYSLWFKMRDLTLLFKSRNMLLNIQYFHECDSRELKIHYQGKYFLVQKYYTPVTAAKF